MAYIPSTWEENALITQGKMENIEHGLYALDQQLYEHIHVAQSQLNDAMNYIEQRISVLPTMKEVAAAIEEAIPPASENFYEIYGIQETGSAGKQFEFRIEGGNSTEIKISKDTTMSDIAQQLSKDPLSWEGWTFSYDKSTGYIMASKTDGESKRVLVYLDDVEYSPFPEVTSFNGRTGAVKPNAGDYTAEMVGAIPNTVFDNVVLTTDEAYEEMGSHDPKTLYLTVEDEA